MFTKLSLCSNSGMDHWSIISLFFVYALTVIDVLPKTGSNTFELSDVIRNFLDSIHLFLQVFTLNEITHLKERETLGNIMHQIILDTVQVLSTYLCSNWSSKNIHHWINKSINFCILLPEGSNVLKRTEN